jgi:cell division septum initiation protein DivIVA
LDEDISVFEGDLKAAAAVRKMEHQDYLDTHKDYGESMEGTDGAIAMIKAKQYHAAQGELVQLAKSSEEMEDRRILEAFLDNSGAPQAAAFEDHESQNIEALEKLKDKFEEKRTELEKEESNSKHAFEMLKQDLTNSINTAKEDRSDKAQQKAKIAQKEADAKGDLQDTMASRDDDQAYLTDLVSTCKSKSDDFEARQTLRAQEIEAIEKAVEIISSGAVSGAADKHLPGLVQQGSSLAQLRAVTKNANQIRVAAYLHEQGSKLNSRVLSALALRVSEDPFKQVKKMIKDMIVRLLEEANEEAEQKGWCDTELSTNEQTRKEKTEAVETLHSEIDELEASISKLSKEIKDLSHQVKELDEAVAKATSIRNSEKEKNTETIKDAKEAQVAVEQALEVLKDFYAKAGEATALVQDPEIFDKPYQGMGGESGGVIGMLEVIQSDFARLETETKASEEQSQAEYDKFTEDSSVDKTAKNKDIEYKSNKKDTETEDLGEAKADLDSTQKELDSALRYYEKLKPTCVDAGVSYEERVARRKEEIESLQEALRILNGEDLAFMQDK